MADGYLKFSCHTPAPIVLDRFSGVSDPTVWIYQAEHYFNFYGFSKDIWLSLPYLYFDGEALAWFNWLYRNQQFYDWKHFTDKLACHYRRQIVMEIELPSVNDLLLQMDAHFSCMRRHMDNIENTLSACSDKFSDTQARPDLTASLADKCDIEEAAEHEIVSDLNEDNLSSPENFKVPHIMLEPHVVNSKVLPELLNSRGSSSTYIHFPSLALSFGCVATLGSLLDSKNDLKNDPCSYARKVFAEMPNKEIDMEVEYPVIIDSENPASHMFDEYFQTISAFKREHSDLIRFDNNGLALTCCISACSLTQRMGKSLFDYFRESGHAKLPLSLYRIPPDQFRFSFPFDPGFSLLPIFLSAASYYSRMVVNDFKEVISVFTCHIDSNSNAHYILPQFPFDPGANLFIIITGRCLQVSTIQPEASNWDLAICSKCKARIEFTARASVFLWRKTLFVLLVTVPCEHKVRHLNMIVPKICVLKVITTTLGGNLIDYYSNGMAMSRYYDDGLWKPFDSEDILQPQRLISLRFGPMRRANAIYSCSLVSRVIVPKAELDNCALLCSSFLFLIVGRKLFLQPLDFTVLTTCSPEMVECIHFEVLNDHWTRYFTKPTSDVFDDALVIALYHDVLDVAGQIHRDGSAQILRGTNFMDCILSLSKWVVSINYTMNVDTPLGSQNEEANARNRVAWVFDMSLHGDGFLVHLANKKHIVTKGYIAPKGHTKLLVSVISHIYNVEIVFFESLYLLKAEGWSLTVISKIWSTVMLIDKDVRELLTPASNMLLLVDIATLIAPVRIMTMISILYYSNLEDKVLIGAEGIVMNGPGPVLAKQPNTELNGYVWDPG